MQSIVRGFLNRRKLSKDNININDIKVLLNNYKETCKIYNNLKIHRRPNFPDAVSENMVRYMIYDHYKIIMPKKASCGDISYGSLKIEAKCFSSDGPISFGPTEKWDRIYFLDARDYMNDKFICYELRKNE